MYRWTYADGRELIESTPPSAIAWDSPFGARVSIVKVEWVEPKTEYRWRVTSEDGDSRVQDMPPTAKEAYTRSLNPVVKVERVEVEV